MTLPTADSVLAYVSKYPGSTCAKIAASIDAPTILVSAALKRLRSEGKVRSRGNTKATRWRVVLAK